MINDPLTGVTFVLFSILRYWRVCPVLRPGIYDRCDDRIGSDRQLHIRVVTEICGGEVSLTGTKRPHLPGGYIRCAMVLSIALYSMRQHKRMIEQDVSICGLRWLVLNS